jgi:hypothetical protein
MNVGAGRRTRLPSTKSYRSGIAPSLSHPLETVRVHFNLASLGRRLPRALLPSLCTYFVCGCSYEV